MRCVRARTRVRACVRGGGGHHTGWLQWGQVALGMERTLRAARSASWHSAVALGCSMEGPACRPSSPHISERGSRLKTCKPALS